MCAETATLFDAGEALALRADDAALQVMASYRRVRPELMLQFDPVAVAAVERDVRYHIDFLVQALTGAEPVLFDDYVGWTATLFAGLGLPEEWLTESVEFVSQAARSVLQPEQADVVEHVVRDALARIPERGCTPPSFVMADGQVGAAAVGYLGALLSGNRAGALRMIADAVQDGMPLEDVYLRVIAPVQAEIGRMWLLSRITVAQEHVATSITQSVLGSLAAFRAERQRIGRTVLVSAVGPELHEVGARMVADFFEMGGWDVVYLGANTPMTAVVSAVEEHRPDLVALSTTMAPHLTDLRMTLEAIRRTEPGRRARILVGGRPFNVAPGLWRALDADGWAPEAIGAVRTACTLCNV